ncbi:MAG: NACHT domain-containing protein [Leptolyngbyaceae cyanobacterium SM1_3_5]|nr:NACHT domain-containing protein [Leptolyngbyaceae cyanobacterium SM1_3_5]
MAGKAARSRRLSEQGVQKVNSALERFGTIQALAAAIPMSRTTITDFCKGRPVAIQTVQKICKELKLTLEDADFHKEQDSGEIDALVQQVREKIKPRIKALCGTMQVLGMRHPIPLSDEHGIYTKTNIIAKQGTPESGLEVVKKYKNLMVLGKPGAGKTIFLQHLAMECVNGEFESDRIPVFIELRKFAQKKKEEHEKKDLLSYIQDFIECSNTCNLLNEGRLLILLDALDEVPEKDTDWVLQQIEDFYYKFSNNHFVITCRISAKNHQLRFHQVEIADFGDKQINAFARSWFALTEMSIALKNSSANFMLMIG